MRKPVTAEPKLTERERDARACAQGAITAIAWFGWGQGEAVGETCDPDDPDDGGDFEDRDPNEDAPCCISTAPWRAALRAGLSRHARYDVLVCLCRILKLPNSTRRQQESALIAWNDDPKRTKEEVIAALQRVVKGEGAARAK